MKRLLLLLLTILILAGCGKDDTLPLEPVSDPEQRDWIAEYASPWDKQGALQELPLNVQNGLQYNGTIEFDGDLLLWSIDAHLEESSQLELCLLELDDGSVCAVQELSVKGFVTPQVLEDRLYLCDSDSGVIIELDKSLQETRRWETEPETGSWYMGADETLYRLDLEQHMSKENLATGEQTAILPGDPEVLIVGTNGTVLTLQYYRTDTGAQNWASLDLLTGTVSQLDVGFGYDTLSVAGDRWLASKFEESYIYTLCPAGEAPVNVTAPEHFLQLLEDGKILSTSDDGLYLHLYDQQGYALSSCQLSENGSYYAAEPIWNEKYGGYFLIVRGFDDHFRLLFWDITQGTEEKDLAFTEIPAPSEEMLKLRSRCEEIGSKYGVTILVGEECDTVFGDFTASTVSDGERVNAALIALEDALADYPEGFLRQLRHDSVHGIQIQLVCDLLANGNGRTGDGYAAFTQEMWDHYLIVADIDDVTQESYYHEFSHVIDSCLEWDSYQREDALYSEENWMSLNPYWFDGYTYDYSAMGYVEDYAYFVDEYSTISPTEDRARIMEYAMADYGRGMFLYADGLIDKLDYYSRCIRDAFDTDTWPETVLWEQYLP